MRGMLRRKGSRKAVGGIPNGRSAVESAYRVDLKRANPDPALLDGDDKGGEGRRGG